MTPTTSVPTAITNEAGAHVARLGMRQELEQMLEHARQIPGLRRLHLVVEPPHDAGDPDAIVIEALRDESAYTESDTTSAEWGRWFGAAFPAEVRRHFCLLTLYESTDAG